LYEAALTATVVAIVLKMVCRFSRRLGSLRAGLPVITAPALFWLTGLPSRCAPRDSPVGRPGGLTA
jgi:hypothetical protein